MSGDGLFSFLSDYIPAIMDGPELPTYISIRPDWSSSARVRDVEKKVLTFERVKTFSYTTDDWTDTRYGIPISETNTRLYKKPKDVISISERRLPSYPHIGKGWRFPGRPRKDTADAKFAQKARLYEIFGTSQFDFEVRVGIINPEANHVGYDGKPVSYEALFKALGILGFYPLAPLKDKKIIGDLRKGLTSTIYSAIKNRGRHDSIKRKVETWARDVRDMVRDYLRGQNTIVPKETLMASTIYARQWKQAHDGSLYKYGDANALWESGTLESDITFEVISLEGGRVQLSPNERKRIDDRRRKDALKASRDAERRRADTRNVEKKKEEHISTPSTPVNERTQFTEYRLWLETMIAKSGFKRINGSYISAYDEVSQKLRARELAGVTLNANQKKFLEVYPRARKIAEAYDFTL